MYRLSILTVGKIKEPWWREAIAEFEKRLRPFARVDIVEVAAEPLTDTVPAAESMKREGERLLARWPTAGFVVALDRTGTRLSSEKLAVLLNERGGTGQPVTFIIGGAAGLANEVVRRAQYRLSLSDLTLTHEMARVFLIEQLYRAAMINAGKKYHY